MNIINKIYKLSKLKDIFLIHIILFKSKYISNKNYIKLSNTINIIEVNYHLIFFSIYIYIYYIFTLFFSFLGVIGWEHGIGRKN